MNTWVGMPTIRYAPAIFVFWSTTIGNVSPARCTYPAMSDAGSLMNTPRTTRPSPLNFSYVASRSAASIRQSWHHEAPKFSHMGCPA